MTPLELETIARDVAQSLSRATVRNSSIFVSTSIAYANGVGVSVRIDQGRLGLVVSDDGYAEVIAEDMGASAAFYRVAPGVAQRAGVSYEGGSFSIDSVDQNLLPIAIASVANASSNALERTIAALEQPRLKRSRELFDKRLKEAFGDVVAFDVDYRGATGKRWEFSAGINKRGNFERLFELVSPSTQGVAMANIKITDVKSMIDPPNVTAALIDYEKTEPALRAMLSNAGSMVIAANADIKKYRLVQ